jgi:RHS repeat-associated protein
MVYSSYGVMNTDSGSVQADYVSYTGREAERDLHLYFYRARFYDPLTGKFMARDPLGLSAGDVNLYRYVGNSPYTFYDPYGLFSWKSFFKGAGEGLLWLGIGVGAGALIAFTAPVGVATVLLYAGVTYGSLSLGFNIGEAITGQDISFSFSEGFSVRKMCDSERSELWGQNLVGIGALAFAQWKIKNISIDKPHPPYGPHINWGPSSRPYRSFRPGHGSYHLGPMAPGGGYSEGSWIGWRAWFRAGSGNRKWNWK